FYAFPQVMHRYIRTTNAIESFFSNVRQRTDQIDAFTTETSCLTIVWAVMQDIHLPKIPVSSERKRDRCQLKATSRKGWSRREISFAILSVSQEPPHKLFPDDSWPVWRGFFLVSLSHGWSMAISDFCLLVYC